MQENVVEVERSQMKMKNRACTLHAEYKGHRQTLGMCHTYCFVIATMVARTALSVTLCCCLVVQYNVPH